MAAKGSVGLALGMGGARGLCHIGVLRALDELGVTVDRVSGCSMGALVGVAWASGRLDALEDWARALTRAKFMGYLDVRLSGGGLVAGGEIVRLLEKLEIPNDFGDLSHPFSTLATDLSTGQEVWFEKGSVHDAIRATVSMPGVITPMPFGDTWLVDGGLVDPVPVAGCRNLGNGPVIAVDPGDFRPGAVWTPEVPTDGIAASLFKQLGGVPQLGPLSKWLPQPPKPAQSMPPNFVDVIGASLDIMSGTAMRLRLAASPPDVHVSVPLRSMSIFEFDRANHAIEAGHAAIMDSRAAISKLVQPASG